MSKNEHRTSEHEGPFAQADVAALFAAIPGINLLLAADAPHFTMLLASDDRLAVTMTTREETIGKPLFDVFADANPDNPAPSGVDNLRSSLETVLRTRATHRMDLQRYDLRSADGSWEERYWSPVNVPVLDAAGNVQAIIHQVTDVTETVVGRQALTRAEQCAARVLDRMTDAHCQLDHDLRVVALNPAAEKMSGRTRSEVLGLAYADTFSASFDPASDEAYRRVAATGAEEHLQHHYVRDGVDVHLDIDAYATDDGGVAIFARDVSERVKAAETRREIETQRFLARKKDEFLAVLAHELRNPLAPVRNGLQILRLAPDDPSTTTRTLAVMERQLAHVTRLIDDLVDVSRFTSGKVMLKRERMALREVLDSALEANRHLIDAGRHVLVADFLREPLFVDADGTRLVQVVGNLINNAVKYTPDGGRITLTGERQGDEAVIRVADSGIGIAPAALPHVFDMFSQVSASSAEPTHGGLGIGLSISRRLIEMHGGSLDASSNGVGLGATFTVRLPVAMAPTDENIMDPAAPSETVPTGSQGILVVDDNIDAADSFATMLELSGHVVSTAYSGADALATIGVIRPSFVFCDIGMPGMNGYEVAQRIRADASLSPVHLIAVTGWGSDEDKRKALDAGFDIHLAKPVAWASVEAVLATHSVDHRRLSG
jgi:PAS domain S-box-containing protein